MRDRLAILAYRRIVFTCCRVMFHVLSCASSCVVRACRVPCRAPFARVARCPRARLSSSPIMAQIS